MDAAALARQVGIDTETLMSWAELGLVAADEGGTFDPLMLERARLLAFAIGRGLRASDIARVCAEKGDVFQPFIDLIGRARPPGTNLTEAATLAGIEPAFARRLWIARGMGSEDELFDDDVEAMRAVRGALEAGLPEAALVQIARVLGDALGRVADAEVRLFHFYVHERLADVLDGDALRTATDAATAQLLELIEPAILYAHHKAFERAMLDDLLLHLAEEVAPVGSPVGQVTITVLFVDLAQFTPLTEAMGDAAVASVLDRFSDLVRDHASRRGGRVVKQIGDEFMVVFPSADSAVRCGVDLAVATSREAQFPALRMGAHAGSALFREADYLGHTVNLAARVAGAAGRGEFLVTDELRAMLTADTGSRALGPRALKGLHDAVNLHAIDLVQVSTRPVDPVCSMELDVDGCDETSSHAGRTWWFCSPACRSLFDATPERYTTP